MKDHKYENIKTNVKELDIVATFIARTLKHARGIAELANKGARTHTRALKQKKYDKIRVSTGKAIGKEVGEDRIYSFKSKKVKL